MRSLLGVAISICALGCSSPDAPGGQGSAGSNQNGPGAGSGNSAGSAGSSAQGGSDSGSGSAGSTSDSAGSAGQSAAAGSSMGGQGNAGSSSNCGGTPMPAPTPSSCEAAPADMPAEAAAALGAVNDLRSRMGLSCMALVAEINVSAQKHCDYYQQNIDDKPCIANAHSEVMTCAGYVDSSFSMRMSKAGYQGSPRSEVMAFSGDPARAVAQWINSVYHRTPLLSPWIREMGYGGTMDCDTIDLGRGPQTPADVTAVYPYPGQTGVPIGFDGSHEGPTPPEPPSGWPSASPVHLYAQDYVITSHSVMLASDCTALPHQWLDDDDDDHYILYPDAPFAKNTEYRVRIEGTRGGEPLVFDWVFTTGSK